MGLFDGIKKKYAERQFNETIEDAIVDGKISVAEKHDLIQKAAKAGIEESMAMEMIEEQLKERQLELFREKVRVAMKDGQLSDVEQMRISQMSDEFGLNEKSASDIINEEYAKYDERKNKEMQLENLIEQVQVNETGQISPMFYENCIERANELGFKNHTVENKLRSRFGQRCLFDIKMNKFRMELADDDLYDSDMERIRKEAIANGFTIGEIAILNNMMNQVFGVNEMDNVMGNMYGANNVNDINNTNDPVVTLIDDRRVRKSQVPIGVVYINEYGQKVKKVQSGMNPMSGVNDMNNVRGNNMYGANNVNDINNTNDPVVTLMDGRRVRKSQVSIGVVYINEYGQKVRKVK